MVSFVEEYLKKHPLEGRGGGEGAGEGRGGGEMGQSSCTGCSSSLQTMGSLQNKTYKSPRREGGNRCTVQRFEVWTFEKKKKQTFKFVCANTWCLYKSSITSLTLLLQPTLDGRQRGRCNILRARLGKLTAQHTCWPGHQHCERLFLRPSLCSSPAQGLTGRVWDGTQLADHWGVPSLPKAGEHITLLFTCRLSPTTSGAVWSQAPAPPPREHNDLLRILEMMITPPPPSSISLFHLSNQNWATSPEHATPHSARPWSPKWCVSIPSRSSEPEPWHAPNDSPPRSVPPPPNEAHWISESPSWFTWFSVMFLLFLFDPFYRRKRCGNDCMTNKTRNKTSASPPLTVNNRIRKKLKKKNNETLGQTTWKKPKTLCNSQAGANQLSNLPAPPSGRHGSAHKITRTRRLVPTFHSPHKKRLTVFGISDFPQWLFDLLVHLHTYVVGLPALSSGPHLPAFALTVLMNEHNVPASPCRSVKSSLPPTDSGATVFGESFPVTALPLSWFSTCSAPAEPWRSCPPSCPAGPVCKLASTARSRRSVSPKHLDPRCRVLPVALVASRRAPPVALFLSMSRWNLLSLSFPPPCSPSLLSSPLPPTPPLPPPLPPPLLLLLWGGVVVVVVQTRCIWHVSDDMPQQSWT